MRCGSASHGASPLVVGALRAEARRRLGHRDERDVVARPTCCGSPVAGPAVADRSALAARPSCRPAGRSTSARGRQVYGDRRRPDAAPRLRAVADRRTAPPSPQAAPESRQRRRTPRASARPITKNATCGDVGIQHSCGVELDCRRHGSVPALHDPHRTLNMQGPPVNKRQPSGGSAAVREALYASAPDPTRRTRAQMDFRILGPLEVCAEQAGAATRRSQAAGAPGSPAPAPQRGKLG